MFRASSLILFTLLFALALLGSACSEGASSASSFSFDTTSTSDAPSGDVTEDDTSEGADTLGTDTSGDTSSEDTSVEDTNPPPGCGNGVVDLGETCDGDCPSLLDCFGTENCTNYTLQGDPSTCDAACVAEPFSVCTDGDGCCPTGCTETDDNDCSAGACGDGVLNPGELCDGDCPSVSDCVGNDACSAYSREGNPATCDAACVSTPVAACNNDDGCCPTGCSDINDNDCAVPAGCGNGILEAGELCDGDCPTSCESSEVCTTATLIGDASTCNAFCNFSPTNACINSDGCCPTGCSDSNDNDCAPSGAVCGNGIVEAGELCDGDCPTSCTPDSCADVSLTGSPSTCNSSCQSNPINACVSGDGCCPSGCGSSDTDCSVIDCTNPATWPADWTAFEDEVLTLINAQRAAGYTCSSGIFPPTAAIVVDLAAREAARCHTLDMATNDFFNHTGSDGTNFSTRMFNAGYTGSPRNENIAAGYSSPTAVVQGWLTSSAGHCDAIMKETNTDIGLGYVFEPSAEWVNYWTAVMGL